MCKKPLLILTGPTAVGKTGLSISLAQRLGGEIISADSMQVYRGMDIGSAKITEEEKCGIEHHLIDILSPLDPFDVTMFQSLAREAIDKILKRGKLPIVVGGTGFYIQALLYGVDFSEAASDPEYRTKLEQYVKEHGPNSLHDRLKEVDPEGAAAIHPNNIKRVIRALEFYETGGSKISEHNEAQRARESEYDFRYFVLTDDRAVLYDRIDRRVDLMMEAGLPEEVAGLKAIGCARGMTSMQGIGYKEILDALNGIISMDEAVYLIKRDSRHFAKRQLTWFRREKEVIWLDRRTHPSEQELLDKILEEVPDAWIRSEI